jgi:hypothetical protein
VSMRTRLISLAAAASLLAASIVASVPAANAATFAPSASAQVKHEVQAQLPLSGVAKAPSAGVARPDEPFYYYDMCLDNEHYPYWYSVSGPSQCAPTTDGVLYIYDSYNYASGPDAVIDLAEVHYASGDSNLLQAEQNCLNRVSCLEWQSFVAAGGSGSLLYGWLYAAWLIFF